MAKKMTLVFPEGKRDALTFSYDDNMVHDRRLVDIMNKYGVKGTFNLNSGEFGRVELHEVNGVMQDDSTITKEEVANLYKGHEIASHTLTHPSLTSLDTGASAYEIMMDRKNLEDIAGYLVNGFAYPYGAYNDTVRKVLETCNILYARTVNSTYNFEMPQDNLELNPTCHHDDERLMELAKIFCEDKDPYNRLRLFYIWGHSFEFARNDNWERMEQLLSYMKPYLKNMWLATNKEIITYYNASKQLQFFADGNHVINPTNVDLWFEVDQKIIRLNKVSEIDFNVE